MGGERLVVYLRPRHFPTDFCHVSKGPGRGKLSCNLAGKYCSGQSVLTLSYCGSCSLLHWGARAVPGQTLLSQEGKETTAHDSSIPDSQATARASYPCSRTEVTLKGKGLPQKQSLAISGWYRSIRGRLWPLIFVWVGKKPSSWRHCHLLLLDITLQPQGRVALRHRDTFITTWEIGIVINLIEVGGVSIPSTTSGWIRRKIWLAWSLYIILY